MRLLPALAVLLSIAAPATAGEAADPSWPLTFFSGRSEGTGEMRILFRGAKPFRVQSRGRVLKDGTLVLRQRIRIEGERPTVREWRLRRDGGTRYTGTLTEAVGPVEGEVSGNRLSISYRMEGRLRLRIRQVLVLQPDGRTIANELTASKFGLPIASVRETIRRER